MRESTTPEGKGRNTKRGPTSKARKRHQSRQSHEAIRQREKKKFTKECQA
jgi:hypothetical protein